METLRDLAQLAGRLSRLQGAMPLLRNRPHDTSKTPHKRLCATDLEQSAKRSADGFMHRSIAARYSRNQGWVGRPIIQELD